MYSGLYVDEAEDLEEEDFIDTTVDTIVSNNFKQKIGLFQFNIKDVPILTKN